MGIVLFDLDTGPTRTSLSSQWERLIFAAIHLRAGTQRAPRTAEGAQGLSSQDRSAYRCSRLLETPCWECTIRHH